jgi:hypothetical protein
MLTVNGHTAERGCYIDGHHGQYVTDGIADVAESFGIVVTRRNDPRRYRRIADYCQDRGWSITSESATLSEGWMALAIRAWDEHIGAGDACLELLNDATVGGSWDWEDGEIFLSDESEDEDEDESEGSY